MKCTNKRMTALLLAGMLLLTGCGSSNLPAQYNPAGNVSAFRVVDYDTNEKLETFAENLCVGNQDVTAGTNVDMTEATAAGLFDVNNNRIIYAKNIHERLAPASLTKVMTAIVALKYGNPDDVIQASSNVVITESGATLCGLKPGDSLTMNQALHALLIRSANDAAVAIAEHIAGSVEGFTEMMNEEAVRIGATNSHFVNPHGLSADNHYVTAYDMYLIFNEAIKYETFREMIHMDSYSTIYQDAEGKEKEMSFSNTNLFLKGTYQAPDKVTVLGGKSGTTNSAGNCLIILSKDVAGNPYISVVMRSKERGILYEEMTDLLEEIYN